MKKSKLLILVISLLFVSGCFNKVEDKKVKEEPKQEETKEPKEIYKDDNPIKVGLYDNVGKKFKLIKDYETTIKPKTDIDTYQIVFSNDEEITYNGNRQDFVKSLWDNIGTKFTLGIILEYDTLNDGHIKHVIYNPSNTIEYNNFIHVYLYDAIAHKNDKWYSHITNEEFNDSTYITSFKLYAHDKIDEVIFPVKISVFTYDSEDDFDDNGNYRGNSIYTIELNKM